MELPASAHPLDPWTAPIAEASARFQLPKAWIGAVILAESGGRTELGGRPTVSSAGAMGLMQLMPATWSEMRDRHRLGTDPNDPRDNILAGSAFLRAMYDRFGFPGLFAAYNAGPARYAEHLATGRPLPAETVRYVAKAVSGSKRRQAARPDRVAARRPEVRAGSVFARPVMSGSSPAGEASLFAVKRDPAQGQIHRPLAQFDDGFRPVGGN
ncbi:MAG TPA: lytic transglycosylase domain-containing protein [Sphingomicrobium sp.]|nr:lytic transglycosylase domain-containing protein [Sphingomicrobium sp.]